MWVKAFKLLGCGICLSYPENLRIQSSVHFKSMVPVQDHNICFPTYGFSNISLSPTFWPLLIRTPSPQSSRPKWPGIHSDPLPSISLSPKKKEAINLHSPKKIHLRERAWKLCGCWKEWGWPSFSLPPFFLPLFLYSLLALPCPKIPSSTQQISGENAASLVSVAK